ncbi:MAG: terminase small subunit-like protein, partial [Phenylobacterium sp.]
LYVLFPGRFWQGVAMPTYPHRGQLKAAIVARVAAGETVAAICSEAGMPSADSVRGWARADAGFAAELAAARRKGAWRRGLMFREDVAAAFLARVAAGEKVRDLLARTGMPSQRAYRYWRMTQPDFLAALSRLRAGGYSQRSMNGHPRWRAWDEAVAARLLAAVLKGAPMRATLASDPAFPSLAVLARWRREHRDWDAALKIAIRHGRARAAAARCRAWAEALEDEVGMAVLEGASLRELGEGDPDLPCARTLYAWRRRWPSFALSVALAADMRDWLAAEEAFGVVVAGIERS